MQNRLTTVWTGFVVVCVSMVFAATAQAKFGFLPGKAGFNVEATNADGTPDLQAGSHPFAFTTTFLLNRIARSEGNPISDEDLKDVAVELPPGLVGNANAMPQCSQRLFRTSPPEGGFGFEGSSCPASSVVGVEGIGVSFVEGAVVFLYLNIYNLVPPPGLPAQFGFNFSGTPVFLNPSVRTGSDYGLTVESPNTSQALLLYGARTTFWGVPADPRHDGERGRECLFPLGGSNGKTCHASSPVVPLLTLPTSCAGPLTFDIRGDSWENPKPPAEQTKRSFESEDAEGNSVGLDGCNQIPFAPSLQIVPNGKKASTPTGMDVNLNVPREEDLNPEGLSEADVKDTTVTLPEGVVLNPAAADGLQVCSEAQVGFEGVEPGTERDLFSPGPVSCPEASKVAIVKIKTPLLPDPIEGAVYLATQEENPFGSLVAVYLVAEDQKAGVRVKLAGRVSPSESGQLVASFLGTPALPFEELKMEFFGTDRAPLATPALCGTYSTAASIAPWSGNTATDLLAPFEILSGPGESACPNRLGDLSPTTLPFAPSLTSGSTNIQAGGFTPFSMTMSRADGNQTLSTIQLRMPPGLLGILSSVKLCEEPQAALGECGPESLIGHTMVSVGLGNDPFTVTGGRVYITGPYKGAPYGLSIVNPAKAGPFDLEATQAHHPACDCLVVRARIEVDLHTSALTITSEPLPTILDGIPLQIKHVNVTVDRPGFTFNPTNCDPMQIGGGLTSTLGATSALAVPFQVTNCAVLGFKPQFKVSTSGRTSRSNGASLDVKLSYPPGSFGKDANIRSVKVDLPKQLPSRLTTLQKACPDSVFNQNPAACPVVSRVGFATASTPILASPLSGPAYFVSHGGAKFPELVVVLSGDGVSVQLDGETFISKAGITSSTFRTIPDVPVSTFELKLPEGANSALAAPGGKLCTTTLRMPTVFTAQNGLVIHQSTPVTATGCAKVAHKAGKRRKGTIHKKKS